MNYLIRGNSKDGTRKIFTCNRMLNRPLSRSQTEQKPLWLAGSLVNGVGMDVASKHRSNTTPTGQDPDDQEMPRDTHTFRL
jgi:hypothetical protein